MYLNYFIELSSFLNMILKPNETFFSHLGKCLKTPPYRTQLVQNYAAKHQTSTRQNICESLRVISVKHSSVLPDDGSHKVRNMSEWFLIF